MKRGTKKYKLSYMTYPPTMTDGLRFESQDDFFSVAIFLCARHNPKRRWMMKIAAALSGFRTSRARGPCKCWSQATMSTSKGYVEPPFPLFSTFFFRPFTLSNPLSHPLLEQLRRMLAAKFQLTEPVVGLQCSDKEDEYFLPLVSIASADDSVPYRLVLKSSGVQPGCGEAAPRNGAAYYDEKQQHLRGSQPAQQRRSRQPAPSSSPSDASSSRLDALDLDRVHSIPPWRLISFFRQVRSGCHLLTKS